MRDRARDEERERLRVDRTAKFIRDEWQRSGAGPLSTDESKQMVRDSRELGRKKRGED